MDKGRVIVFSRDKNHHKLKRKGMNVQMVADDIQNGYAAELTRTSRETWARWNQRRMEQGSSINALREEAADREEHEVLSEPAGEMISQLQTLENNGCVECGNTFNICGFQKSVTLCRNCRAKRGNPVSCPTGMLKSAPERESFSRYERDSRIRGIRTRQEIRVGSVGSPW